MTFVYRELINNRFSGGAKIKTRSLNRNNDASGRPVPEVTQAKAKRKNA